MLPYRACGSNSRLGHQECKNCAEDDWRAWNCDCIFGPLAVLLLVVVVTNLQTQLACSFGSSGRNWRRWWSEARPLSERRNKEQNKRVAKEEAGGGRSIRSNRIPTSANLITCALLLFRASVVQKGRARVWPTSPSIFSRPQQLRRRATSAPAQATQIRA